MIQDTIVAQATPPGFGGVAIVRVSGPLVNSICNALFSQPLIERQAAYLPFYDETNTMIDKGLALYFPNPNSFTGEDILELHSHGSPVVVDMLLQRLIKLGARLARPGEFSERAFHNGKIDLVQAEAIADLIHASSKQAAQFALRSLEGEFSKAIQALVERVIYVRMYIEAAIDFTDEEIDFLAEDKIQTQLEAIVSDLEATQSKAHQGRVLQEGLTAVIVGAPNVGKSSLLNTLSGKEVAIVTSISGTTRDVLRNYILIDGMPLHIVDTAGLRETKDVVEQEGIRRAHQEMLTADLILSVSDDVQPEVVLPNLTCPVIHIRNKIDLMGSQTLSDSLDTIYVSARTGVGIETLRAAIKQIAGVEETTEGIYLARRRHLDALDRAYASVQQALLRLEEKTLELVAEELRQTQLALNEITGEFTTEDLLGKIFASFCIGK